ncbi:hypothetical protein ABVF11_08185 [Pediococcus argentinicus]|uniref:hypothetical protein n=1 Tax=Pediococcus argentinicus TaxID=480391 RepID=UPI00338EFBD7
MAIIASYSELRDAFNGFTKDPNMKLPAYAPDGNNELLHNGPIRISMNVHAGQVDEIKIHSDLDQTPGWDEAFEGFEQGMGWSSINFFNAYQQVIKTNQPAVGEAHGITATHTDPAPRNDLTVTFKRN